MSDILFSLPVEQQITPCLTLCKKDELPVIVINHPKAKGAISLQGAHVLSWQPEGEKPILWLSPESNFKQGVAIRGGIPICWPWFGKAGDPMHGFARNQLWQLIAHDENDECVWLTFSLEDNEQTRILWPHSFSLIARIKMGETCEIELESHGDYSFTSALHTYLNIGDIDQISVSGLGPNYLDKVVGGEHTTADKKLTFSGLIDRIYTQPESFSVIADPANQRSIEIHHKNASDAVAWNPGAEVAKGMADMPDDGYKTMVCVETAYVTNARTVTNDKPQFLSATIRCHKNEQK